MEMRIRPKSDYLHKSSWEELYVLTKHWQSDLDFYRDEIRFLSDLMGKYFMWLVADDNIKHVNSLTKQLSDLGRNKEEIARQVKQHLKHLEALMENAFSQDEQKFRKEHEDLEDRLTGFIWNYKVLKKEIFKTTEKVIEEEKLNRLLN